MSNLTVVYKDGSHTTFQCECISYDARVIFAKLNNGKRICIPYTSIYSAVEEDAERSET